MKEKVVKVLSTVAILSCFSTTVFASGEVLGWTEGEEVSTTKASSKNVISPAETIEYPDWHNGYTESNPEDSDTERAVAETGWEGEYHYSRARMVMYLTGEVRLDSGRVWDWDETTAKTDWGVTELVAKTYWGN
ncbi:hypothetical protein [Brevibacillus sp. SYSU BS000544]|uniref:hypothetical protein n=1 Tax=Brevibacillus sp. SYSU BS000544 TaxID=3416443 RepID=UPI003CE5A9BA